jgi:hypothetical protein
MTPALGEAHALSASEIETLAGWLKDAWSSGAA